jgi:hypothetical protein
MVDSRRVTVARARPLCFQLAGEAFDASAADRGQGKGPGAAPAGGLAQVQGVSLAGQAALPGQEPSEGESFGVGEGRLDRDEDGSGHRAPPGRAETPEAAPAAAQRLSGNPPYAPSPVTPGHNPLDRKRSQSRDAANSGGRTEERSGLRGRCH